MLKRERFKDMIKDCEKGKIDLILTKSVSRFARNTVDSLSYVRKLKAMGIGVFFEEQNIDTLKTDSEMFIGLYSVMAQSESENINIIHSLHPCHLIFCFQLFGNTFLFSALDVY